MGLLYTARDFSLADATVIGNTPNVWSPIITFSPAGKRWGIIAFQVMVLKLLQVGGAEVDGVNSWLRWEYFTASETLPVQGEPFVYLPWYGQDFKAQMSSKRHGSMFVSFVRFETLDFTGVGARRDVSQLVAGAEVAMVGESAERARERQILEDKKIDLSAKCFWLSQFGRLILNLKSPDTFNPGQAGNYLLLRGSVLET